MSNSKRQLKIQKKLTKQILEWEKNSLERVEETISEAHNAVEECSTKKTIKWKILKQEVKRNGNENCLKIIIQNYWKTTIFISQTLNEKIKDSHTTL